MENTVFYGFVFDDNDIVYSVYECPNNDMNTKAFFNAEMREKAKKVKGSYVIKGNNELTDGFNDTLCMCSDMIQVSEFNKYIDGEDAVNKKFRQ